MSTIVLPEGQQRLLNWLLDPRAEGAAPSDTTKGTQNNLARAIGVDKSTLSKWKKDPKFVQAWHEQLLEATGGPEAMAVMMKTLVEVATDKKAPAAARVAAARQYIETTDKYSPRKTITVQDPALLNMEDEDLLQRSIRMHERLAAHRRSLGIDGRMQPIDPGENYPRNVLSAAARGEG